MLEDSAVGEDGTKIPRGTLHVLLSSFGQFATGTKSISRVQIINWKSGTGACNPCLTARIHPSGNSSPESKSLQHGVKIQMEGGHPGPTSKKHFSAINKRLQTLIQSYKRAEDNEDEDDDENDKVPFLRSVARNIEFNVC
ncbi:hypothetical protein ACOMHN_047895 [Nucella lapillus]